MMRFEELLPDILRRWWIFLLAGLVAGVVGYAVAIAETEEYSVSVRLVAVAEPADYWLDLYAKNRLGAYEPLINNYIFVQAALADAGLEIDPVHAQRALAVSHESNRNTLSITVVDTDPQRAADIANAIQDAFVRLNDEQNASLIERVERDPETFAPRVVLTELERAGPPSDPIASGAATTAVAAALLGTVAGGLIVILLIYRDDSLRSTEDLERHLGQPLLVVVPNAGELLER